MTNYLLVDPKNAPWVDNEKCYSQPHLKRGGRSRMGKSNRHGTPMRQTNKRSGKYILLKNLSSLYMKIYSLIYLRILTSNSI